MFTCIEDCQAKREMALQVAAKLRDDILPILQEQPGFVDFMALTDATDPGHIVHISVWQTKEDAERYQRMNYDQIAMRLKPLLRVTPPSLEVFSVDMSTTHMIAGRRAA